LWVGTQAENNRDAAAKGRGRIQRGEANPRAKHTEEKVLAVRRDYAAGIKPSVLAARYGVTATWVYAVTGHRMWKHI
jgi:hypothetical protein